MSKVITWLHLSDLHLSPARAGWKSQSILKKLRADLQTLGQRHALQPDFVFFTGDIAYGHLGERPGERLCDQYDDAALFLKNLLGSFDPPLPLDRLFLVPGNHDVHRKKIRESTTAWLDKLRDDGKHDRVQAMLRDADTEWLGIVERLGDYRGLLERLGANHLLGDPERLIYAVTREVAGIKVGVAGLNTAWSCGRDKEKGQLWLGGEWQATTLEQQLQDVDLTIALLHHPPSWFGELEDPSVGRRLESVFDFTLHGHEHDAWVTATTHHIRIAAGAVHGYSEQESGYNIVRIHPEERAIEIWLRRYSGQGAGGWVSCPVPGLTDDNGYVRLDWTGGRRAAAKPQITPPPPSPEPKPADGPEVRGVYGRRGDIASVAGLLAVHPIVALYGLSGIGKTELMNEVLRSKGSEYRRLRFRVTTAAWTLHDLYGHMARDLGDHSEVPEPPPAVGGQRDWASVFDVHDTPLIWIEDAHHLFQDGRLRDPEIGEMLAAIVAHVPKARVVLECRTAPESDSLGRGRPARFHVSGVDGGAVRELFRDRPFLDRKPGGWELTQPQAEAIARRLGNAFGAHPMALRILADVARARGVTPVAVLDKYPRMLWDQLLARLFGELFEHVLSPGERHVLRLAARYRVDVPESIHAKRLNVAAGDEQAFQGLERRCLLAHTSGRYAIHGIVRDLAMDRAGAERAAAEDDHEVIAGAWLETIKETPRRSPVQFEAAAEAAYHLVQAGDYLRLGGLRDLLQRQGDLVVELAERSPRLHQAGRYRENRAVLELLVALDPDEPRWHSFLGEVIEKLERRGDAEALRHYEEALRLRPGFPQHLADLGRCLLARREGSRFIGKIEALPQGAQTPVVNDHVLAIYLNALEATGRHEEASRLRQDRIAAGSRDPAFYVDEASYLLDRGQPAAALDVLDGAARHRADDEYTAAIRGKVLEALGRGEEASRLRQDRIAAGSRSPAFYNDEASYLFDRGQPAAALDVLDGAARHRADDEYTAAIRGKVLEALGRGEEASRLRQDRNAAGSRQPVFYNDEASYLLDRGQPAAALNVLDQAEQCDCTNEFTRTIRRKVLAALEAKSGRTDGEGG